MAFVGMSTSGETLSEGERQCVVEVIIRESLPVLQQNGSRLAFEACANLATAKNSTA